MAPPAFYERTRDDRPPCTRQVPDCDPSPDTVDLGDLGAALNHPDVVASWPGRGEKTFSFEGALTDLPIFQVEAKARGTIVVAPQCGRSGCIPPPEGVGALSRTLRRLVAQVACP